MTPLHELSLPGGRPHHRPGRRIGAGEGPLRALGEREGEFVLRRRATQPDAVAVDEPDVAGGGLVERAEPVDQRGAEVVGNHRAAPAALRVEDRGADSDRGVQGPVRRGIRAAEVEARDIDLAGLKPHDRGEIGAATIVAARAAMDDHRIAAVPVDAGRLAAAGVDEPQAVVIVLLLHEEVQDLLQVALPDLVTRGEPAPHGRGDREIGHIAHALRERCGDAGPRALGAGPLVGPDRRLERPHLRLVEQGHHAEDHRRHQAEDRPGEAEADRGRRELAYPRLGPCGAPRPKDDPSPQLPCLHSSGAPCEPRAAPSGRARRGGLAFRKLLRRYLNLLLTLARRSPSG